MRKVVSRITHRVISYSNAEIKIAGVRYLAVVISLFLSQLEKKIAVYINSLGRKKYNIITINITYILYPNVVEPFQGRIAIL